MTADEFNPGDIVRIKDADRFTVAFGNRVRDRDAVVLRKWRGCATSNVNRYRVLFKKRGRRGIEFEEWISSCALVLIQAAEVAA